MLEGRMADLFFKMARAGKRSTSPKSILKKIASSRRSSRALGSAHLGRPVFVEQMHCNICRWTQCGTRTARSITPSAVLGG